MSDESKSDDPKAEADGADQATEGELSGSDGSAGDDPAGEGGGELALSTDPADQLGGEASVQQVAAELGVAKYVHSAFFAAGVLAAYLAGQLALAGWNALADYPDAVRAVPALIEYTEEERGSLTLIIGAVVGLLLVLRYYRRPSVKNWATEVAGELARVTWPTRETVTNGTVVVLVAGAVATFYVAVLDRLWGYLTNLIYGA